MKNEKQIKILKKTFVKVEQIENKIRSFIPLLKNKIELSKDNYKSIIRENNKKIFIFGLEPFNFQNKIFEIEFKHIQNKYNLISNHLYSDYFKLFSLIRDYCLENIHLEELKALLNKTNNKYNKYDPINVYKSYNINEIKNIFNDILEILILLDRYLCDLKRKSNNYRLKLKNGFNINNFLYTFQHKIKLLDEKIVLYINFIKILINTHTTYIEQFLKQISLLFEQINNQYLLEEMNNSMDETNFNLEFKPQNESVIDKIDELVNDNDNNSDNDSVNGDDNDSDNNSDNDNDNDITNDE